jgi:hypothetical protein
MIDPKTIRTLTEFQRSAKAALQRLRKTGQPEVLTVNGKAALIVQDADAYFRHLEDLERTYEVEAVRVGIEQIEAGKGIPLEHATARLRTRSRSLKTRRRSA